jgi:hypothetical protein
MSYLIVPIPDVRDGQLWVNSGLKEERLDDCFGDFLVRVSCSCSPVREIEPEALARLVGWRSAPILALPCGRIHEIEWMRRPLLVSRVVPERSGGATPPVAVDA